MPETFVDVFREDLVTADPDLASLLAREERRNLETVNLIASESYCPRSTLEAEASLLANKNVYGYPGDRGVAGCAIFDEVERLAQRRARDLFDAEHVNVQALSSTIGNIAVLRALVPPGGCILAFDESAGGHHSHGADYHLAGRDFEIVRFGADEAARTVDYAEVRRLAQRHRPSLIVAGSTSFPYAIDFAVLADIAKESGARLFADIAHVSGLVAARLLPNPVAVADVVTTSTHKTFCGPRTGGIILCRNEVASRIDEEVFPGLQGAPGAHIVAARAVLFRIAACEPFRDLMRRIQRNARHFADALLEAGLTLYLGGTDTHMVVVDLRRSDVDALKLERLLEEHGLLCSRVSLPSIDGGAGRAGLRFGTTAMTIRGIGEDELASLAHSIAGLIGRGAGPRDHRAAATIAAIAADHPIPKDFLPIWFHDTRAGDLS